jgi:hypothetical protein
MPGERGTLTRGAHGGQGDGAWPEPTAPAGRRLPRAPRERKPALAALALLLILGGALGAAYLVIQNGQRVAAIEVAQPVGAGQRIPAGALREVQISTGGGVNYVPWSEASQVTQFYAANAIPAGTLLSGAMVSRTGNLAVGKAVLGLALKDGQLPDGLQVGDHVNIYEVSDSSQSCPGAAGTLLASGALVLGIGVPQAAANQSAVDVRVALAPAAAGAVACNAANGNVAVAVIPARSAAAAAPPPPASAPPTPAASKSAPRSHGRPSPARTG